MGLVRQTIKRGGGRNTLCTDLAIQQVVDK